MSSRKHLQASRATPDRARAAGGSPATAAALRSEHLRTCLVAAVLGLAVFLAYQPAWHGGFVWDDDTHLLNNPVIHRPDGLSWAWTSGDYINYWPMTFTVYRLEYDMWGLNPLGFHLVNIALHAVSALLVWRILKHLQIPGAMLAAAVFALHPVNVESVAWISQLKNVLSLSLALLSLLFYLRHERSGGWWQLAASVVLFLLSALAKGMLLTLPAVLLACDWWQRGRIGRRDLLRVLPFALIAALMISVEVSKQHTGIGSAVVRSDNLLGRAAVAGCAVWFYLWKVVWPFHLSFVYPRWSISPRDLSAYLPGVLLVVLLAIGWWRRRSWGRPVVMLLVCYVALLGPILGFTDIIFMQYSLVADHWQYAAMIVPCGALAAAFTALARRIAPKPPAASHFLALGLLAILATLTYRQSEMYADIKTLYRTTIERNPDCWLVQNNLGNVLTDEGQSLMERGHGDDATARYEDAIALYRDALRAKPDYANARLNLGSTLARLGRIEQAIAEFQTALKSGGNSIELHCSLAKALVLQGRFDNAVGHYRDALKSDPKHPGALNDFAWLRATCPDPAYRDADEAVDLAERSLALWKGRQPPAQVLDTLAAAYAEAGSFANALRAGRRALDLATMQGHPALAEHIKARLQLYLGKRPYRQPATQK